MFHPSSVYSIYDLNKYLGGGSYGKVYRGHLLQGDANKFVAVK